MMEMIRRWSGEERVSLSRHSSLQKRCRSISRREDRVLRQARRREANNEVPELGHIEGSSLVKAIPGLDDGACWPRLAIDEGLEDRSFRSLRRAVNLRDARLEVNPRCARQLVRERR